MPTETTRKVARKTITLPSGSTVDIGVITEISWLDPNERAQETQHTVTNIGTTERKVHVDEVFSTSGESSIDVERIDVWPVIDPNDRYQETQLTLDNVTGGDSRPPHFTAHLKTHLIKYRSEAEPEKWVECELIDAFSFIDANDRYQETQFTLFNPQNDDDAAALIGAEALGGDEPYRTDPFQNIVNFNDGEPNYPPLGYSTAGIVSIFVPEDSDNLSAHPFLYSSLTSTYAYPPTFPPLTPETIGVDPSQILMMLTSDFDPGMLTNPGPFLGSTQFWGRQSGMPGDQGIANPLSPPSTSSLLTITKPLDGVTMDFSAVEFVPFQYPVGTSTAAGNFLDYYPTVTTGATGWKYVPLDVTAFSRSFIQPNPASNVIYLIWMPVETF